MTEIEWVECDDPELLAAAAAAGVAVELAGAGSWLRCAFGAAQQFERGIEQGGRYRIPSRVVWPPALTVPEGMTPERLREMAVLLAGSGYRSKGEAALRWADDLAAQIEGGGADEADTDDPFPVGCRVRHLWRGVGVITRPDHYDGISGQQMLTAEFGGIAAEVYVRNLTRIDSEPDPDGRTGAERYLASRLAEPMYAHAYESARNATTPTAPESSPDGEGGDGWTGDVCEAVLNDLNSIIHQHCGSDGSSDEHNDWVNDLANEVLRCFQRPDVPVWQWPEVPDGHEVLVVPSATVDRIAEGHGSRPLVVAARDAVARRPKPEPRVERVPAMEAVEDRRMVSHPAGPFEAEAIMWIEGEMAVCEYGGWAAPIRPDGTVDVLAEDGES